MNEKTPAETVIKEINNNKNNKLLFFFSFFFFPFKAPGLRLAPQVWLAFCIASISTVYTVIIICATCVIVFNVDADVATGAASTSRQKGKKDDSRIWRKTSPRINSYTTYE